MIILNNTLDIKCDLCVHFEMYIYIYIYIYTHTHTHTHTHTIRRNVSYISRSQYLHLDVRQDLVHNIRGIAIYIFPTMNIWHVARMGEERGVYRVLVGKPEGRRPLGRPRRRWGDNIRMDLQEVGCGYVDWIGLAQDRDRWRTLVSTVMNLRFP